MVNHKKANPIGECKLLHFGNHLIVACIAEALSVSLTNLLKGVDDNERGVRVLIDEQVDLRVSSLSDAVG